MKKTKVQGEVLKTQEKEFNEQDSLLIIKEMIQVSRKRLGNNGIIFIIWGWTMLIVELMDILVRQIGVTESLYRWLDIFTAALLTIALLLTVYFVFIKKKRIKSYINDSLKIVWFSMGVSLVLINLILYNQGKANDGGLLVPVAMLFISTAIVVTAGILRYNLLIFGGIVFGLGGYLYSFPNLEYQFIIGPIAYLLAFIIPGHIMYKKRKHKINV